MVKSQISIFVVWSGAFTSYSTDFFVLDFFHVPLFFKQVKNNSTIKCLEYAIRQFLARRVHSFKDCWISCWFFWFMHASKEIARNQKNNNNTDKHSLTPIAKIMDIWLTLHFIPAISFWAFKIAVAVVVLRTI